MNKRIAIAVSFSVFIVVVSLIVTGCGGSSSNTQTGKLTGQEVTMNLSDAMKGTLSKEDIGSTGRIIITTDSGKEVKAFIPNDMVNSLRGGQTLEIKMIKGSNEWVVSKILKQP